MSPDPVSAPPRTPRWVWLTGSVFVLGWGVIVVGSIQKPDAPVFTLHPILQRELPAGLTSPDTVTLDARAEAQWVRFELGRRRVAGPGDPWDLAVRRHRLIVNGGEQFGGQAGVVLLDDTFGSITEAPAGTYAGSRVSPNGDSTHALLDRWYAYGFLSHMLEPAPGTFVLRTHDGRYAKLRVLGYYCPGPEAGCLTLEYVYQGDGGRRLAP